MSEIIIGTRENNTLRDLFESRKGQVIFVISFLINWRQYFRYTHDGFLIRVISIFVISLLCINTFYIVKRFMCSIEVPFDYKVIFAIIETLLFSKIVHDFDRNGFDGFFTYIIISIYLALALMIIAIFIYNILSTWKVHAKNNEMYSDTNMQEVDKMEGHDFEYYCANILSRRGFEEVEVTKGSGDHGIDILANKDGIKYAIQCKRYAGKVGNHAVQEAYTGKSLYSCDIGVVMTNSEFTPQAIEEANRLGIKLWSIIV